MGTQLILLTRQQLRVLLMMAAKVYQEATQIYGEGHARAIAIAADATLECVDGYGDKSSDKLTYPT